MALYAQGARLILFLKSKPPATAGREQGVFFLGVLNDSRIAVRIFPGPLEDRQYCLDFVDAATHEPLDAPFYDYELWSIPPVAEQHQSWTPDAAQLATLEDFAGIPREERVLGQQKFLLQDGLHCFLCGTEHKPMREPMEFWIPIRKVPQERRTFRPAARKCQFDV